MDSYSLSSIKPHFCGAVCSLILSRQGKNESISIYLSQVLNFLQSYHLDDFLSMSLLQEKKKS